MGAVGATISLRASDGEVQTVSPATVTASLLVGSHPWRTFRAHRGQHHYSGFYWSATMGDHVVYESRLELARLLFADHDHSVVAIYAQPFLLRATVGGRPRRHVPDYLLVHGDDSLEVVDVKPEHRLASDRVAEALRWAGEVIGEQGWGYEVWSEPNPTVLANLRFVAGSRRPLGIDDGLCSDVLACVSDRATPIRGVERALVDRAPRAAVRAHILHLLWRRQLDADWTVPMDSTASVWVRP